MNATSKGTSLSFPRHCTHGSLAKVVIPEKTESAVTVMGGMCYGRDELDDHQRRRTSGTIVITGIHGLVWEANIVQWHLYTVMMLMTEHGDGRSKQHQVRGDPLHVQKRRGNWLDVVYGDEI